MEGAPDTRLGRVLAALVGACARRPRTVVAVVAVATAAVLPPAVGRLGMHVDPLAMLREDAPYRQLRDAFYEAFPSERDQLLLVVDAPTPDAARDAAVALEAKLAEHPELFLSVERPGGGTFFERFGLLYRSSEELEELVDRLAELQPALALLARDPTLHGLFELLARSVGPEGGEIEHPRELVRVVEQIARVIEADLDGRPLSFSWQEVFLGSGASPRRPHEVLVVSPVLDREDLQPARRPIEAARAIAAELEPFARGVARLRITGDLALSFEEMQLLREQGRVLGVASFVLVGAILFLFLRSGWLVLASATTLLVGLAWTAVFAAFAVGHLNMVSVAFAVLFIGLGVDFAIHFGLRVQELRAGGLPPLPALEAAARDVGSSLVLCALTTSLGFFVFVPTDFLGVAELGLISGAGILIALLLTLSLHPALLVCLPGALAPGRRSAAASPGPGRLAALPERHPRAVVGVAAAAALGSLALAPRLHFDANPLEVRDPEAESVRTFRDLLEDRGRAPWSVSVVTPDLASAERLAERIRGLPTVDRVVTVSSYVPRDQREKLSLIEDAAMILGPTLEEPPVPARGADPRRAIARLRSALASRTDAAPELRSALDHLDAALAGLERALGEDADPGARLARLEERLLGNLPERLRLLRVALSAGPVSLEDLPASLRRRMVTPDGRARVQVFPAADLDDERELARFVDEVRSVTPAATGNAVSIVESARAIASSMRQALISASLAITLLLFALWRRVRDTLFALAPLALASLLTAAAAVLLGIPMNFANVIVLPLLLGIGVDSGIHLVHRARLEAATGDAGRPLLATGTARGVVASALTTLASFGSLAFAAHRGMASMGQLLTLGVLLMLASNLLVLPALLALERRGRRGDAGAVSPR